MEQFFVVLETCILRKLSTEKTDFRRQRKGHFLANRKPTLGPPQTLSGNDKQDGPKRIHIRICDHEVRRLSLAFSQNVESFIIQLSDIGAKLRRR